MSEAFNVSSAWKSAANEYKHAMSMMADDSVHCIVEIGVDFGYSLFTFARDFPNAIVFGVDDFAHHHDAEDAKRISHSFLNEFKNARIIHLESAEALKEWREPTNYLDIDILHIDADHSYEGVKRDFELWSPCVRPGGLILFHDIISHKENVGKFFDELVGEKMRLDIRGAGLGAYIKNEE